MMVVFWSFVIYQLVSFFLFLSVKKEIDNLTFFAQTYCIILIIFFGPIIIVGTFVEDLILEQIEPEEDEEDTS